MYQSTYKDALIHSLFETKFNFSDSESAHPVPVILVTENLIDLKLAILVQQRNAWVRNAVEHVCLYGCVVYHILEHHLVANLQWLRKLPTTHIVTAQTAVAAKTVDILLKLSTLDSIGLERLGSGDLWLVWHFKTVGHVTGEADVKDCGTYATALHDIHNLRHKRACLPSEC